MAGMKRWLALAGALAAPLAACSSSPHPVPPAAAPDLALHTAAPRAEARHAEAPHTATLAAGGRQAATLDVLTGTTALKIGVADLGAGGALLRVSTPEGDPPPHLTQAGAGGTAQPGQGTVVDLSAPGASAVTVTLNAAVRWRLVLGGGTTRTTADLRGTRVTGISLTAGSDVVSLALPRPRGIVTVRLTGGASQFLLSLPRGVPARVTAAGGAGGVSLEGRDHAGIAGGSVFTTPGWTGGAPGFDIDATAGAARVTVTARDS